MRRERSGHSLQATALVNEAYMRLADNTRMQWRDRGLARIDPRKAQIVGMRFFGGLTVEEIGEVLSVSTGTIKRDWRAANVWLYRELTASSANGS